MIQHNALQRGGRRTRPASKESLWELARHPRARFAAKRADDEEAALKLYGVRSKALSSPTRAASSFAQLAVDCRAPDFVSRYIYNTKEDCRGGRHAASGRTVIERSASRRAAHGVVSLTKLARAFVSKRDARNKWSSEVDEEQEVLDWRPFARRLRKGPGRRRVLRLPRGGARAFCYSRRGAGRGHALFTGAVRD